MDSFEPDFQVMKEPCPELLRVQQLLDKLEQRARTCRGLFPVASALEFLNLASDQECHRLIPVEELSNLNPSQLHLISLCLERFWRDPSLCQQVLAQCLLRHGRTSLKIHQPGSFLQGGWFNVIQKALQPPAETTCQNTQLKSA